MSPTSRRRPRYAVGCALAAIAAVTHVMFGGFGTQFTTGQGVAFTSGGLFACSLVGLAVTLLIVHIRKLSA